MPAADSALLDALAASQALGMLGGRPVAEIVEHAQAFVGALTDVAGTVVDLGSGGGVPGLVIARARPDLRLVLVDRRASRTDHLRRLVGRLDLGGRVDVVTADATSLSLRADAAVARGFGPPDVTLRTASRLLQSGGLVVVSEPPTPDGARWPGELLLAVGAQRLEHADRRVALFHVKPQPQPATG